MAKQVSPLLDAQRVICLLLLASLSLACGVSTQEAAPPTPAVQASALPTLDFATTPAPEISPSPLPSPTQSEEATAQPSSSVQQVQIYLIALEDGGVSGLLVGCGDSVVPVSVEIPATQGVLLAVLENLLALDVPYYGTSGLFNALHQSDLQVQDVAIVEGEAQIYLTGSLLLGGECDAPRVQAQLEQTALQFSTVQSVSIFINDIPLEEALASK